MEDSAGSHRQKGRQQDDQKQKKAAQGNPQVLHLARCGDDRHNSHLEVEGLLEEVPPVVEVLVEELLVEEGFQVADASVADATHVQVVEASPTGVAVEIPTVQVEEATNDRAAVESPQVEAACH